MVALVASVALFGSIGIITGVWQQTVGVLRPAAGGSSRRTLLSVDEEAVTQVGKGRQKLSSSSREKKRQHLHPSFYSGIQADGVLLGGEGEDDDAPDEHPECADSSAVNFFNISDGNDT